MYLTTAQELRRLVRNAGECLLAAGIVTLIVAALLALDNVKAGAAPTDSAPVVRVITPESGGMLPPRGEFVAEDDIRFDCRVDGDQECGRDQEYLSGDTTFIVRAGYYGK